MNRSEAMAPLGKGEARFPVTSGIFVRRGVRRVAMMAMVDFYEDKGFLESTFIFRGPAAKIIALRNHFAQFVD